MRLGLGAWTVGSGSLHDFKGGLSMGWRGRDKIGDATCRNSTLDGKSDADRLVDGIGFWCQLIVG